MTHENLFYIKSLYYKQNEYDRITYCVTKNVDSRRLRKGGNEQITVVLP